MMVMTDAASLKAGFVINKRSRLLQSRASRGDDETDVPRDIVHLTTHGGGSGVGLQRMATDGSCRRNCLRCRDLTLAHSLSPCRSSSPPAHPSPLRFRLLLPSHGRQ